MTTATKKRKILTSPQHRERLKGQITETKELLARAQAPIKEYEKENLLDAQVLQKRVKKIEAHLESVTPPKVVGRKKDELLKRTKELEKQIKDGMPSKDEMMGQRVPRGNNMFGRDADPSMVQRNIKWQEKTAKAVEEWKYLKKVLEPDNPSAGSVETLRQGRSSIQKGTGNKHFFDMRNNPLGKQD